MSDSSSSTPSSPASSGGKLTNASALSSAESAIGDMYEGKLEGSEPDILEQEYELEEDGEVGEDEGVDADPFTDDGSEGSASNPYNVKTLPDAHVTIKVDGEEKTVSLREMVDGYMREGTFHKRVAEVTELKKRAVEIADTLQKEKGAIQTSFRELVNSPEDMYQFLEEHAEDTLDKMARLRLRQMLQWHQNPQAKFEYDRRRQEEALEKRRAKLRDEETQYRTSRQHQEATERYRAEFEPGFRQGIKEAGYPKMTDELRTLVTGIISARRQQLNGKPLTGDDIRYAVVKAARIASAETVANRKPPPPKQGQRPAPSRSLAPQRSAKPSAPKSFRDVFKNLGK